MLTLLPTSVILSMTLLTLKSIFTTTMTTFLRIDFLSFINDVCLPERAVFESTYLIIFILLEGACQKGRDILQVDKIKGETVATEIG